MGRPRFAVPKDDMMPPGLQSTCASSCRGLAGHSLCRERVHGLCCFRGGAARTYENVVGMDMGGRRQELVASRQNLVCTRLWHKVLPHWLCQRFFPGRTLSAEGFGTRSYPIGSVVSRQTLVCTRLQHKVLPHWLFQVRLLGRYLFVGADALRSTVCLCRR